MQHYPPLFLAGENNIFIHTHLFTVKENDKESDPEIDNPEEFGFVNKTFNLVCDFLIKMSHAMPVTDHYQHFSVSMHGTRVTEPALEDYPDHIAKVVQKYARVKVQPVGQLEKIFIHFNAITSAVSVKVVYLDGEALTLMFAMPVQLEQIIFDHVSDVFKKKIDAEKFPNLKEGNLLGFFKNFVTSNVLVVIPASMAGALSKDSQPLEPR